MGAHYGAVYLRGARRKPVRHLLEQWAAEKNARCQLGYCYFRDGRQIDEYCSDPGYCEDALIELPGRPAIMQLSLSRAVPRPRAAGHRPTPKRPRNPR